MFHVSLGKTYFVVKTLINSQHTMQEKVERVVILAKHTEQDTYMPLLKAIPCVIFVKPTKDFNEETLMSILSNSEDKEVPTAILIDDVSYLSNFYAQFLPCHTF